jgi:hypothetical protein
MMMMIPFQMIAFFLATLLLPIDVRQFTIDAHGETIQWTKEETVWHAVKLPKQGVPDKGWPADNRYWVAGNSVFCRGVGKDESRGGQPAKFEVTTQMTNFLALAATTNASTIESVEPANKSFGTPIQIKREQNRITLSQTKGTIFETPATITWKNSE